jgi:hypothetical protein
MWHWMGTFCNDIEEIQDAALIFVGWDVAPDH